MAELYQNYYGLQEFCKPPNKLQTRNTFITSSPRWLITLMAILPFLVLSKGRLVSLLRVALGRASHRDTKTRRQERRGRGFASWERRGPPRPLCSAMPTENWTRYPPHHFDSLDPQRVMEITFEVARLGESLSRRHQDTEKTSRPEHRRPLRHQHLTARQVYGNSETRLKNASIRGTDPSECGADTTTLTAHRPSDFLKVVIAKRFFPRAHGLFR